MTREEAIEYLKRADTTVGKKIKTRTAEALEMAIKALEECSTTVIPIAEIKIDSNEVVEMVLEKIKNGEWIIESDSAEQINSVLEDIKAEIKSKVCKEFNGYNEYEMNFGDGLEMALQIIDKHISGKEKE